MSIKESEVVIARLKQFFSVGSDSALCEKIAVSPQTLSSWKMRNSIPYAKCVEVSNAEGVSLDWLLTGRGPVLLQDGSVQQETTLPQFTQSDLKLLELLNQLEPEIRRDILRSAEEKQRVIDMEKQIQELSVTIERLKNAG